MASKIRYTRPTNVVTNVVTNMVTNVVGISDYVCALVISTLVGLLCNSTGDALVEATRAVDGCQRLESHARDQAACD